MKSKTEVGVSKKKKQQRKINKQKGTVKYKN